MESKGNDNNNSNPPAFTLNVIRPDELLDGSYVKYLREDKPVHVITSNTSQFPPFHKPPCTSQGGSGSIQSVRDASPASSSSKSWETQSVQLQLNDGYKSVSSVTSGAPAYAGKALPTTNEQTYGTIRSVSPPPTPSGMVSKSPTMEGSQYDKPGTRRGGDRKKKASKNVLRETLINPEKMPGYKGNEDIDKLLQFVEGSQNKTKKVSRDKKGKEAKPRGNEKQVLSKAASLDENSLGYGSKKSDEPAPRHYNSKEVEKKNSTNITKSATAICTEDISTSNVTDFSLTHQPPLTVPKNNNKPTAPAPLVNGTVSVGSKAAAVKLQQSTKSLLRNQAAAEKSADVAPVTNLVSTSTKSDHPVVPSQVPPETKQVKVAVEKKNEEEKPKPDEAEGPYVLVQKKKREKKKGQQRENGRETFVRAHPDQARRESGRPRRSNAERRKSVGSVPGSENSECSDDDDSVRSLPAGECTPRERIPKPCSSSGGTPQTSYADIARMSKDENGKITASPPMPLAQPLITKPSTSIKSPPISTPITTVVAVASDSNFPALSGPTSDKTVSAGTTVVWPCKPRTETDVPPKDKSPDSKIEDIQKKEPSLSQSEPFAESILCSSKTLTESKDSSQGKSSEDLQNCNETNSVPGKQTEVLPSQKVESLPATTGSADALLALHTNDSKTPMLNSKSNSLKNFPQKIVDESSMKVNSLKLENGDLAVQTTEAVVFCGGKFDNSQLPAGQHIGFEFGFGVIEALNDNGSVADIPSVGAKSPESTFTPSVSLGGITTTTPENHRSQSQTTIVSHNTQGEKKLSPKEPVTWTNDNQTGQRNFITTSKTSIGLTGDQATKPVVQSNQGKLSPEVTKVPTSETKEKFETPVAEPSKAETSTVNNSTRTSNEIESSPSKVDIAQIYVSPECVVLDALQNVDEYMNTYTSRLTTMMKEGKVTFLRI